MRPRGWHLDEKHVLVDGQRVSGGIFDFALVHVPQRQGADRARRRPVLLPAEDGSHLEARLWNDIFVTTQNELGLPQGTIKATVLIETILAAFEMDEILYELREHSPGLNAGRWDYIFSLHQEVQGRHGLLPADRAKVTMTAPFMRAYALLLLKTCHKRNAPAIGGMSALIPIKNDPARNEACDGAACARQGARRDRRLRRRLGRAPGPGRSRWRNSSTVLGDRPNQIDKQRDDVKVSARTCWTSSRKRRSPRPACA